jgi:hypothetical protein
MQNMPCFPSIKTNAVVAIREAQLIPGCEDEPIKWNKASVRWEKKVYKRTHRNKKPAAIAQHSEALLAPQECKKKIGRTTPCSGMFSSHMLMMTRQGNIISERSSNEVGWCGDTRNSLHRGRGSESLEFYCLSLLGARTARSLRWLACCAKEWPTLLQCAPVLSYYLRMSESAAEWWEETCPRGALSACRGFVFLAKMGLSPKVAPTQMSTNL